jgi:hypothetical protein
MNIIYSTNFYRENIDSTVVYKIFLILVPNQVIQSTLRLRKISKKGNRNFVDMGDYKAWLQNKNLQKTIKLQATHVCHPFPYLHLSRA